MALTLAEAKVGMRNKIYEAVIDQLQRNSDLLNRITFDDTVSQGTGGSTLVYGWQKTTTAASAQGRAINQEYTPQEAKRTEVTTTLQINGGSYEIDRVIAKTSSGFVNEVAFQTEEKTKATASRFTWMALYGDSSLNATTNAQNPQFDGVKKQLTGTSSLVDGSTLDVSGAMTEAKANEIMDAFDNVLSSMSVTPDVIYANSKVLTKVKQAARILGFHESSRDEFGRPVETYNGIPLVDLKQFYNGTANVDVIPVTSKKSDIFFISYGLNALHGCSPQGGIGLDVISPNFNDAGAVKKGEVEMVAAVAVKNTTTCAVLKDVVTTA